MRVNLHDYSGHPFQVQLSRYLASRGHEVVHGYSTQYVTGHGRLTVGPDDPPTLRIEGITASAPMVKYSMLGRTRFEWRYAEAWQAALDREDFDVVIACNVPLFAMARMRRYFARRKQPWIFWHQDIYSAGVADEASRRFAKPLAAAIRVWVERLERAQVRDAAGVVAITDSFLAQYRRWNLRRDDAVVIPNWAPLDEIVPRERDNAWAARLGLARSPLRLLYAGTLGRKHNPHLLIDLLDAAHARGVDAMLVVVSEGEGAEDVARLARSDVCVLGYQPADKFSDVLGSADVLVALLEPDAAKFSVPSKVLSYLCAGRPIVALMPEDNPSAADVREVGGVVGGPWASGVSAAAQWLAGAWAAPDQLTSSGNRARALAECRFDIDLIGAEFAEILGRVACSQVSGVREDGTRERARR